MTASIRDTLQTHIKQKHDNLKWLADCLEGKTTSFPYRPSTILAPTLSPPIAPTLQSTHNITPPRDGSPLFLVNLPMGRLPSKIADYSKYTALIQQFRDESFGTTTAQSAQTIKTKVAIVIGINQIESIDPDLNQSFEEYIQNIPLINSVVSRTLGFKWKPRWTTSKGPNIYPIDQGFFILKSLSPQKAEKVRKAHEQPKGLSTVLSEQIPFQKIRENIKKAPETLELLGHMEAHAPASPIYFTMMDDDSISLRTHRRSPGVFSKLHTLITQNQFPSIVSPGYVLNPHEAPLLRLAVKIDMAVRATMPMPYFPEPCTAIKVRQPNTPNFLPALSFIGPGRALESRRLIQSGKGKLNDGAIFQGEGIITTTPARMKTVHNQSIQRLTSRNLKTKKSLQALRGRTIQTHAFPKQWADILYAGLPFSTPKRTNATGPMMHIFNVYDPISRMHAEDGTYASRFDNVMTNYGQPLTPTQKDIVTSARGSLRQLKMTRAMIDLIEQAAVRAGKATHRVLKETEEALKR